LLKTSKRRVISVVLALASIQVCESLTQAAVSYNHSIHIHVGDSSTAEGVDWWVSTLLAAQLAPVRWAELVLAVV